MNQESIVPVKELILIALVQGLCLFLLHQSIELKFWPYTDRGWLISLYSVAFIAPTLLLLSIEKGTFARVAKYVAGFSVIAALVGFYTGWQSIPEEYIPIGTILPTLILTMVIAAFKALMYIQQLVSGKPFSYSQLFRWSWRNFLTLSLSLLFALCFWGVLMLWAFLFKAIKINLFHDLFTESWFYYPAVALANGFGVIIFRNLSSVIDTITRLQQALMKFLLVILSVVSVLFLFGLLVSGLSPLWETGGSALILWMQAIMLFFLNAVYQDEPDVRPYHIALHRIIMAGVALLPLYSLISFYGLSLRVDQYGWSLMRCWAFIIWGLLALFSFGYLKGIITKKDAWVFDLSRINVVMGLVVWAVMVVVNSPVLDLRKIVVSSQIERYESSGNYDDFSPYYFKNNLGRPGYIAMEQLKKDKAESNPQLLVRINAQYFNESNSKEDVELMESEFIQAIEYNEGELPWGLGEAMYKVVSESSWEMKQILSYKVISINLNDDNLTEYVFIRRKENRSQISVFYLDGDDWKSARIGDSSYPGSGLENEVADKIIAREFEVKAPAWKELEIDGMRIRVH